ncbi:WAP four-disulfide core domain protein 3 [Orycteropus afer afer]|uniref:WAP four-disulfide core domain protein 3 n=1 Tax=Orycteropus afer afer TaxID=1230840 RepID=A0A8B6ZNF0_ORYAF|nr:WAP four-disulfide core domain protein 3 [Orycteropus afer afer]
MSTLYDFSVKEGECSSDENPPRVLNQGDELCMAGQKGHSSGCNCKQPCFKRCVPNETYPGVKKYCVSGCNKSCLFPVLKRKPVIGSCPHANCLLVER